MSMLMMFDYSDKLMLVDVDESKYVGIDNDGGWWDDDGCW
jgi:hypothetical protein